jgi:hypothetical protein
LEDVLQKKSSRNDYITETLPLAMSKNTIESDTEQEDKIVESTSSLSPLGASDSMQEINPTQMSSPSTLLQSEQPVSPGKEEGIQNQLASPVTVTSTNDGGDDDVSTSSMEGKSQLRNFLSVAKAKWDNVPQGWMQQRTSQ